MMKHTTQGKARSEPESEEQKSPKRKRNTFANIGPAT